MFISFWALAVVVEDFFVPALNILCIKLKMPDDVAGATFMAAGASSPELFAAVISLFVTRTALGIGTIIGSEIFNHLCICAGSVLYSKSGVLELDPRILAREVVFYGLAILALLYCESERRKLSFLGS
jgi:Ca2+/Na+ antiporter